MAFKMRGFPKRKDYLEDKTNPEPVNGRIVEIGSDGGPAIVETPKGQQEMSGLGIAEMTAGMTIPLLPDGAGGYKINGSEIDKALTGGPIKKATHTMPDGTVMPGAKHRQ